ncbi:conserved protein of unknown function [Pseudomonas sp. JV551A1]|uniref:Uncharacterized protein n=1 Tax=Pseudomonas inefficax TaxID=2078786 RepID=A0AAQ1PD52_9PSED|nr:conserved protein of unknown function [Pseudomonas sp. JV551A1]SPO63718.1 conserved protein of unknown function [Pseudomonas inefficax]
MGVSICPVQNFGRVPMSGRLMSWENRRLMGVCVTWIGENRRPPEIAGGLWRACDGF